MQEHPTLELYTGYKTCRYHTNVTAVGILMKCLLFVVVLIGIVGCSGESPMEEALFSVHQEVAAETKQRQRTKYLAYEHQITIELSRTDIEKVFQTIIASCGNDTKSRCTILHSSLNTGGYTSSNIKIRILPQGVESLLDLASKQGEVTNRSTDVIDLKDAIINSDKRLNLLLQYQSRLIQLEEKTTSDVDALIKIAEELSKVQSDIEYAEGEKAKLFQRTNMDIVRISLRPISYASFWEPISESIEDFGKNLSEGISHAITAVAYFLPWALIVVFTVYLTRVVWRKTRGRKKE